MHPSPPSLYHPGMGWYRLLARPRVIRVTGRATSLTHAEIHTDGRPCCIPKRSDWRMWHDWWVCHGVPTPHASFNPKQTCLWGYPVITYLRSSCSNCLPTHQMNVKNPLFVNHGAGKSPIYSSIICRTILNDPFSPSSVMFLIRNIYIYIIWKIPKTRCP